MRPSRGDAVVVGIAVEPAFSATDAIVISSRAGGGGYCNYIMPSPANDGTYSDAQDHGEDYSEAKSHHDDKQVSTQEARCLWWCLHGLVQVWLILRVFEVGSERGRVWKGHDL